MGSPPPSTRTSAALTAGVETTAVRRHPQFLSIRDSTGLLSQPVSSAQLVSSRASPAAAQLLAQDYTSFTEPGTDTESAAFRRQAARVGPASSVSR